jgi:hypothetical protein
MKLTRLQLYFLGLLLLLLPLIVYKLIWLKRSVITRGVVLDVYETRRYRNTYPRIQFNTYNNTVTFSGHYNSPYEPGDSLDIRYIPSNPTNYSIDTFWNIWIVVIIINGMLFVFWSFLFLKNVIPQGQFLISSQGIKKLARSTTETLHPM